MLSAYGNSNSQPTRLGELANWFGVEILNMFNIGSRLTVMKSVVDSANSGLDSKGPYPLDLFTVGRLQLSADSHP